MEKTTIESALKLHNCVFDEISFRRKGFQNKNEAQFNLGVNISEGDDHIYRVSLLVTGEKKEEYELEIKLTGYFEVVDAQNEYEERQLITGNAVAILFPYVRSEVSILTAQPETKSETLPIINVYETMNSVAE